MECDQYLVVWKGDGSPQANDDQEIFGEVLNATTGATITSDFLISSTTPVGTFRAAEFPAVAFNSKNDEVLIAWESDGLPEDDEKEIFGQRIQLTGPAMSVSGNSVFIEDEDASPSTTDDTDFGTVNVGDSGSDNVDLNNTTASAVTINSITSDHPDFTISNVPGSVASQGTETFSVNYQPSSAGEASATLTIDYDTAAKTAATLTIDLTGTGNDPGGGGTFTASVSSLDFGTVTVGSTASEDVDLDNTTASAVAITSITSDHPDFTVSNVPGSVASQGTETFSVNYQPSSAGPVSAALTIDYTAGNKTAATLKR